MNYKQIKFENKDYLSFIRSLPCCISGSCGDVDAHHAAPISRKGVRNDYYAIPVKHSLHIGGCHISKATIEEKTGWDLYELVLFYNSLYAEYLNGMYDPEEDIVNSFMYLRGKMAGK